MVLKSMYVEFEIVELLRGTSNIHDYFKTIKGVVCKTNRCICMCTKIYFSKKGRNTFDKYIYVRKCLLERA